MNALFQIRPYHPRDLDAAASAVNRAIYMAYASFGYPYPASVTSQRLLASLEQGEQFWVPESNGAVVGLLSLKPNYIEKLFIAPEWQGHGIGSALIRKAKSLYHRRIDLDCFQENRDACRLYEAHGFCPYAWVTHDEPAIPQVFYRWEGA
jgi:GNAT superfamily N-acetyltransferase